MSSANCPLPSVSDSCERRYEHIQWIERNNLQQLELLNCADCAEHWINHYVYTLDPRGTERMVPFDLFPKQAAFLEWIAQREQTQTDGLCEKSRDTGASWICCLYALHAWLFRANYVAGFGSRKLEYVDTKGNPKSIFEKFRIAIRGLPLWMMPRGFNWNEHDCLAKLMNPENGSVITGEGGDGIGRGDRTAIYFVDEAAFLERPQLVESSLSQTTNVRIDISTPNGPGNPFAKKRFSGNVSVFTLHWKDDPRKDAAWYAAQTKRFDPVTVAQEIDIDYTASLEGIMIPAAWVRAAVELDLPVSGRIYAGLDVAEYGRDTNVFTSRQGPVVREPIAWGQCNTTETTHRARDEAVRLGVFILNYDCIGVGAGVRGTFETSENPLSFIPHPVNTGASPSDTVWPDGKTSKELFVNLRAEIWWKVRKRFEKAYECVVKKIAHPPEEMISIPNHPQLIAELSQPLTQRTETGKIKLESKDNMRRRGIKSPNFADSLVMAFIEDAVEPWEVPHDPGAQSIIGQAPPGVWMDDGGGEDDWRSVGDRWPGY